MQQFIVMVPVKSYVKTFLEANCDSPVNLSHLPVLKNEFRRCLKKPSRRYDSKIEKVPDIYKESVEIIISEDDFYRFGWELTRTDIIAFGKEVENLAKSLMRSMVGVTYAIGLPINKSIERFQMKFGFSEEDWTYQTIKKDFYRNGKHDKIDFDIEIFNKIEQIVLENLYNLGTISRNLKKQYESNQ